MGSSMKQQAADPGQLRTESRNYTENEPSKTTFLELVKTCGLGNLSGAAPVMVILQASSFHLYLYYLCLSAKI